MSRQIELASIGQLKLGIGLLARNQGLMTFGDMVQGRCSVGRGCCCSSLQSGLQRYAYFEGGSQPGEYLQITIIPALCPVLSIQQHIAAAGLFKNAEKLFSVHAHQAGGSWKGILPMHFGSGRLFVGCRHKTSSDWCSKAVVVRKLLGCSLCKKFVSWAL